MAEIYEKYCLKGRLTRLGGFDGSLVRKWIKINDMHSPSLRVFGGAAAAAKALSFGSLTSRGSFRTLLRYG
jgi:hypothetical protein